MITSETNKKLQALAPRFQESLDHVTKDGKIDVRTFEVLQEVTMLLNDACNELKDDPADEKELKDFKGLFNTAQTTLLNAMYIMANQ